MKQDSSWRKILDKLLPEFLAFYFPEIHRAIDFSKGIEFLDKELQKILPKQDDRGKRVVDKLVKVFLREGSERLLLLHIEVQGYRDPEFSQRVYNCNYRITDRFGKQAVSVALLTDENPDFRDHVYEFSLWEFRLHFEFPAVKLLDYGEKWAELEQDSNPFAIVTRAFLKTVETSGNDQTRFHWKKEFLLELYRRGLTREMIAVLYEFIDVVMALPKTEDEKLYEEIKQSTEEKTMSVMTTAERVGMKKGVKKVKSAVRKVLYQTIADILEIKFGAAGLQLSERVQLITNIKALQKIRLGLKQTEAIIGAEALITACLQEQVENGHAMESL